MCNFKVLPGRQGWAGWYSSWGHLSHSHSPYRTLALGEYTWGNWKRTPVKWTVEVKNTLKMWKTFVQSRHDFCSAVCFDTFSEVFFAVLLGFHVFIISTALWPNWFGYGGHNFPSRKGPQESEAGLDARAGWAFSKKLRVDFCPCENSGVYNESVATCHLKWDWHLTRSVKGTRPG